MKDLRSYIESGVLELYVLGDLSPEESLEVQQMAADHPEVKTELEEIERSLELYAYENAVEPSENQRNKILNSLQIDSASYTKFKTEPKPAEKDNVISFTKPEVNNFFKYAFAACLGLLLLSLGALVSVYKQLQQSNEQVAVLSTQNTKFSSTVKYQQKELGIFRDPSVKLLSLLGTKNSPSSSLSLAWSPVKQQVFIDLANLRMPANDKAHQYQLWAIVAGKPVDLGVFDSGTDSSLKQMKSVAAPQAFAVTLEPRGGSINPTMNQMMVIHMM